MPPCCRLHQDSEHCNCSLQHGINFCCLNVVNACTVLQFHLSLLYSCHNGSVPAQSGDEMSKVKCPGWEMSNTSVVDNPPHFTQLFTVGWATGRASEWWGAGVVVCLEWDADLHMAQLMPLPLTFSCFSKIQIGFTFLVLAHLGSPRQRAVKRVCVCVCVRVCALDQLCHCDIHSFVAVDRYS